jgi:hypothetical protein
VLAGEDEQSAQEGGGLGGAEAEEGEYPPVLEVAEAVLDGGAGGGQGLVGVALGGGGLGGPGGFVAGDDDGVAGVGVQAGEAEVGQGAEPGGAQRGGDVVVAGGGDLIVARARSRRSARAASSPMISQVHRSMVEAETPLPPAMSARRWSWRSVARTMSAIFPGGSGGSHRPA